MCALCLLFTKTLSKFFFKGLLASSLHHKSLVSKLESSPHSQVSIMSLWFFRVHAEQISLRLSSQCSGRLSVLGWLPLANSITQKTSDAMSHCSYDRIELSLKKTNETNKQTTFVKNTKTFVKNTLLITHIFLDIQCKI